MIRPALLPAAALLVALAAAPARAQDMPGMDHAAHAAPDAGSAAGSEPAPESDSRPESGAEPAPGQAPPPPVPTDHPADRFFPAARMAPARAGLAQEGRWHGHALTVEELEYRARAGTDGWAWKLAGWTGGDIDRLVVASEGEASLSGPAERIELRAFWRHAIDPWFNLELGVRHDFRPAPQRSYAVLGIEGEAPFWIELAGQLLISDRGDLHLRLQGSHDLRLSGPVLLAPEARLDLALQDVPALGIGAGAERLELGARLRYEILPELAPYLGVHWERSLAGTATRLRAAGEPASAVSAVIGIRGFF